MKKPCELQFDLLHPTLSLEEIQQKLTSESITAQERTHFIYQIFACFFVSNMTLADLYRLVGPIESWADDDGITEYPAVFIGKRMLPIMARGVAQRIMSPRECESLGLSPIDVNVQPWISIDTMRDLLSSSCEHPEDRSNYRIIQYAWMLFSDDPFETEYAHFGLDGLLE